MAILVDLLAKYLVEWPDGANYIEQGLSGALYSQSDSPVGFIKELSEDSIRVTYNQYLAARDRMHAEIVQDIKVGGTLEVQEFDTDQALWIGWRWILRQPYIPNAAKPWIKKAILRIGAKALRRNGFLLLTPSWQSAPSG